MGETLADVNLQDVVRIREFSSRRRISKRPGTGKRAPPSALKCARGKIVSSRNGERVMFTTHLRSMIMIETEFTVAEWQYRIERMELKLEMDPDLDVQLAKILQEYGQQGWELV